MDREYISGLVHRLNDVELAVLLCLVADKHCILSTEGQCLHLLQRQLELAAISVFGLSTTVVHCAPETSLDDFAEALLLPDETRARSTSFRASPVLSREESYYGYRSRSNTLRSQSQGTQEEFMNGRKIANIVIARDLDLANPQVQAQALELMRTRQFSTRKGAFEVPERFLFIAMLVKSSEPPTLTNHLRDHFFISHYHPSEEGFPEDVEREVAEAEMEVERSDSDSLASVVIRKLSTTPPLRRDSRFPPSGNGVLVSAAVMESLKAMAEDVTVSIEIKRHIIDIVVFIRNHRAVAGGVSARATKDFELLVRCLSPLHGLDFATPSLKPEGEKSSLWGSKAEAIEAYLKHIDVEGVLDEVATSVRVPV
ncbi:uncharacterized protein H6S33_008315 [Morchella sextelata]|uniref:uncharacterized protein n=1 Tax=Morchella sextelata TaxID=1174677 RepID=UPI001D051618|nr:uncharacterized protein H6S33_008315 [Morchella sextelata]KAH0602665.1 hypothetical protein H6S33_008315 [Morchella sextelata]